MKFTRAIDSNELFVKQSIPYVYPLFKLHKVAFNEISDIQPNEVSEKIPSRLVVGMKSCQLSRLQAWLEGFLTPLAKQYGKFEFIIDSNDALYEIEELKLKALSENWDWDNILLFTLDVKALYPSVKLNHLHKALHKCFQVCTDWSDEIISNLINIIVYTLNHQQILWNNEYYMINQGIPTGGKHSVPIANIFLTFIFLELMEVNSDFHNDFNTVIKLWKRYIDDGLGIFNGDIDEFLSWFKKVQKQFEKYDLQLTVDTDKFQVLGDQILEKDSKFISFLDIEIFIVDGTIHTREHRKETSSIFYLRYNSAHTRHTFSGIIKSQLYRLRRLCSRDVDFLEAVNELKVRCLNSGYPLDLITNILESSHMLTRSLAKNPVTNHDNLNQIRLVTIAGTMCEKEFVKFAARMNPLMRPLGINIQIVKSIASSIGQLLFNNREKNDNSEQCDTSNCLICTHGLNSNNSTCTSTVSGKSYRIDPNLSCHDAGIYVYTGGCKSQYTGKTTTSYSIRTSEHLVSCKDSSVLLHRTNCGDCINLNDCSLDLVENYLHRRNYSLSEREYLWNARIKGTINIQKTLR